MLNAFLANIGKCIILFGLKYGFYLINPLNGSVGIGKA